MKILNFHGYKGNKNNSVCQALQKSNFEVVSPEIYYDDFTPKEILNQLLSIYDNDKFDAVVGTSAGGFYAVHISVLKKCPAILINPCLLPFIYLPELGYSVENGVTEFSEMFDCINKLDKKRVYTIIGEKDEVIDTHEYTKNMLSNQYFYTAAEGRHSGFTLPLKDIFEKTLHEFLENNNKTQ